MRKRLKNSKLIIFLSFALFICAIFIYNRYWKIDFGVFSEIRAGGVYYSPNDEYSLRISILIPRDNTNEYFIMGTLVKTEYISENMQIETDKNSKIIYWKKELGDEFDDYIYVKWVDDKKVQIEDKVLNIKYDKYDYRKDLKGFFTGS